MARHTKVNSHFYRTRGIRNPGVRQCLGFCTADFLFSLAYESADQKPKHCLTPGFLIPLYITMSRDGSTCGSCH